MGAAALDAALRIAARLRRALSAIYRPNPRPDPGGCRAERQLRSPRRLGGSRRPQGSAASQGVPAMSPTFAGLMIIACLFALLATGMPIAFALGLAAFLALYLQSGAAIFFV